MEWIKIHFWNTNHKVPEIMGPYDRGTLKNEGPFVTVIMDLVLCGDLASGDLMSQGPCVAGDLASGDFAFGRKKTFGTLHTYVPVPLKSRLDGMKTFSIKNILK